MVSSAGSRPRGSGCLWSQRGQSSTIPQQVQWPVTQRVCPPPPHPQFALRSGPHSPGSPSGSPAGTTPAAHSISGSLQCSTRAAGCHSTVAPLVSLYTYKSSGHCAHRAEAWPGGTIHTGGPVQCDARHGHSSIEATKQTYIMAARSLPACLPAGGGRGSAASAPGACCHQGVTRNTTPKIADWHTLSRPNGAHGGLLGGALTWNYKAASTADAQGGGAAS